MKGTYLLRGVVVAATLGWTGGLAGVAAACDSPTAAPPQSVSADETLSPIADGLVLVADAEKADENEVICERVADTGTRLSKRVCKTRGQRELERQNAKETVDAIQHNGGVQKAKDG